MPPFLQVIQVILMIICFLLKADIVISLLSVAVFNKEDEPLCHIPKEKGKIEQFLLLHCMYPFVIKLSSIQRPDREDKPEQTYCQIGFPHRMPLNQNHFWSFDHTVNDYVSPKPRAKIRLLFRSSKLPAVFSSVLLILRLLGHKAKAAIISDDRPIINYPLKEFIK